MDTAPGRSDVPAAGKGFAGLAMRREYIYSHRSVRLFPVSRVRLCGAVGLAALLSAAIAWLSVPLLSAHGQISRYILRQSGVQVLGESTVEVFPHLGPATAPRILFPDDRAHILRTGLLIAASVVILITLHRSVPLARNFVVFLLILVCAAGAVVVFNPSFHFDSIMYAQIWLRGEILVWLILPWVSAFLFILTVPSLSAGVAWALLLQVYAVAWSAVRLAFCLGVLHYTGIVFLPLLWFCLGVLFDVVYILVFYSLALRQSIAHVMGERVS